MIDKDCSSSLIFGIVCQIAWGSVLLSVINSHKLIRMKTLKSQNETGKQCCCEKILVLFDSKLLTKGTAN